MRKLFAAAGLFLAQFFVGCSMCQDCYDETGPVPDSPNFGAINDSPRAGTAISHGMPVGYQVESEPTPAGEAVPAGESVVTPQGGGY